MNRSDIGYTRFVPQSRRLFAGIFLIAFATLLVEVSLVRVLSFTIWYHFAYVVISTALLGFGASGTVLALRPSLGGADPRRALASCSALAGVTGVLALAFAYAVVFEPLEITKSGSAVLVLLAYQIVFATPFAFAGMAVSLALREAALDVDRLYFWDLMGAGLGCAASVPLMNALSPPGAVLVGTGALFVAAAVFARSLASRGGALALGCAILAASFDATALDSPTAPSKTLNLVERLLGMRHLERRWTGLFSTDVVQRTSKTPQSIDDEWGLSRTARGPIQAPWGFILHDATAGAPMYDLREGDLEFLDQHVLSLPYVVRSGGARVLVIGVGGGKDVMVARRYGASQVIGIELDPATAEVLRDTYADLNEGMFHTERYPLIVDEGRHYLRTSKDTFDVIQMTGVDTLAATTGGAYVLAENYLYTVEAFEDFLDRLAPSGILSVAAAVWNPEEPRAMGRMAAVAAEALRERGVADPLDHIVAIDSRRLLGLLMVKNEAFTEEERRKLAASSDELDFRPLILGDRSEPLWARIVREDPKTTGRAFFASFFHDIRPTRDDNPFFFHFFRWKDAFTTDDLGPFHTSALSQVVLGALLAMLTLVGIVVVLGPLTVFRRRAILKDSRSARGLLGYFAALGMGFMLFEISLIQRFVSYLGYPTYALSVVLFSLLWSLGAGSFLSRRWVGRER
jgi:hypothetical protein